MNVNEFYSYYYPIALFLSLLVFMVSFAYLVPLLKKEWNTIAPWIRWSLLVLFVVSLIMRTIFLPHTSYNIGDEVSPFSGALMISETGRWFICDSHNLEGRCIKESADTRPPTHSVVVSLFLTLFGRNYSTMFMLMAVLTSISILTLFFFTRQLFGSDLAALISSLFFAATPVSLLLSGSGAMRNTGQFFIIAMLFGMLLVMKKRTPEALGFFFSSLILAMHTMPELVLLLPIAAGYLLYRKPRMFTEQRTILASVLFLSLISPYLYKLRLDSLQDFSWQEYGSRSAIDHLSNNLFPNIRFLFEGEAHLLIVIILFAISPLFIRRNNWVQYALPAGLFTCYFLLYSGYVLGMLGDSLRYNLILLPFICTLAAFTVAEAVRMLPSSFRYPVYVLLGAAFLFSVSLATPFFIAFSHPIAYQQEEFTFLTSIDLPEGMIIANNPIFTYSTTGRYSFYPHDMIGNQTIRQAVYENPEHFFFYRDPLCKICTLEELVWDANCPHFSVCYHLMHTLNETFEMQPLYAIEPEQRFVIYSLQNPER